VLNEIFPRNIYLGEYVSGKIRCGTPKTGALFWVVRVAFMIGLFEVRWCAEDNGSFFEGLGGGGC
jgi:hypothetical protein